MSGSRRRPSTVSGGSRDASRLRGSERRGSIEDQRLARRKAGTRRRRFWPLFLMLVGIVALVTVVVHLLMRPSDEIAAEVYPVTNLDHVVDSAERHDVDPYLVCAIIKCESNWNSDAVSEAGAIGLMQVMPDTATSLVNMGYVDADEFSPARLGEPATNIEYGCACLEFLYEELDSTDEVIAAYNAGVGSVQAWKDADEKAEIADLIAYPETAAYLERVNSAYEEYKLTYPDGLTEK